MFFWRYVMKKLLMFLLFSFHTVIYRAVQKWFAKIT